MPSRHQHVQYNQQCTYLFFQSKDPFCRCVFVQYIDERFTTFNYADKSAIVSDLNRNRAVLLTSGPG
jgi:hypothetical protein